MGPLDGVRVLDLSRVVSGPFATMLLADLGADVNKIEEPEHGDDSRAFGPPFCGTESACYLSVNRNKRSCAVNLKSPEGVRIDRQLAAECDVLIDNFRPGTLQRIRCLRHLCIHHPCIHHLCFRYLRNCDLDSTLR